MTKREILRRIFMISVFVCLSSHAVRVQTNSFADQDKSDDDASQGGLLYFVNTTSDVVVVGACQNGNPGCSLRGAIQVANTNPNADDIDISIPASDPFCSAGVCTIKLTGALPDISTSMGITGPGADTLIVRRSSGGNYRIFNVTTTGTAAFSGITIKDGYAVAARGGGIQNGNGTINVTNCALRENVSDDSGGGLSNAGVGTINVTNSTIANNRASGSNGTGGGIFTGGGTVNVTNSTLDGNTAFTIGAAIFNSGTMNVTNSTISGGISFLSSGGIFNSGALNLTNSTITRNYATASNSSGGGIVVISGTVNVKSCIIAMNSASMGSSQDVEGSFVSAGFNLIGKRDGSTGFTTLATDQTGTVASPLDPKLDPNGLQNNGGPTKTVAQLVGSPAIDKGTSSGLTGNLTTDQRGAGFPRTFDNAIPNPTGGNGTDIGAFEWRSKSPADFDGDGKTDISIFRPAPGEWWYLRSSNGGNYAAQFGAATDKITPGDFTGDGKTDIAFFRPSNGSWFVLRSEDFSFFSFPFGASTDIPAPGDFDGDGKTDVAIFRPSETNWYIRRSSDSGTTIQQFGANGDAPVPADYDGDGKSDIAIYRPSLGQWWINRSSNNSTFALQFGALTDKPVQGDYTGDGKSDVAFWRPSTGEWFILRSEDFSFFSFPFGVSTDIPAPGDYDGDGRFDASVFRPSNSTWFIQRTTAGTLIQGFGIAGDKPVPNAFVP